MPAATVAPLTLRSTFPIWAQDKLRYGDTDRQGHVNNAVFSTFFETGRVSLLLDPTEPIIPPGCSFVIARITIDYRREVHWPGLIDIGSGVLTLGRSSFTVGQGAFKGEECVATAESVLVMMDLATGKPTPLTEKLRQRLSRLQLASPAG